MTQVVSSISGIQVYAPSAGFAPTNSADVSAIASGYQVVSATATQLYAGTAYLTSVNDAPVSASRAGNAANASMANSAYYDGTGRLISSLPDEATVSSIASSYAESAASGKQDSSAMTAYQLSGDYAYNSSLSGYIPTSESSKYVTSLAGYATEEYVDSSVSGKLDTTAQVVSSTAGDGTYVTAINGMGISGQAGGGGGGIDSATCSSIASAYAESAASSKLDITAYNSGDFYTTSNESGYVDSAYVESRLGGKQNSGNYISAKGLTQTISNSNGTQGISFGSANTDAGIFMTGNFGTAYYKDNELNLNRDGMKIAFNIGGAGPKISSMAKGTRHSYMYLFASGGNSGTYSDTGIEFKDSANNIVALYDSATYGKITSVHDTVSANSATWGAGATGDYVEKSATNVAIGSINGAESFSFAQGIANNASSQSFAQGGGNTASATSFAQGYKNEADSTSFAQGQYNSVSSISFAQGYYNTASANSFAQGYYNIATNTAAVFGQFNLHGDGDTSTGNSAAFAIGDGTAEGARHDLMLVTKDGEITMYSSTADTVGTGIMSSIRAISAAATGGGDVYVSGFAYNDTAISSIEGSSLYDYSAHARITTVAGRVNNKMDSSAVQSAYASASATQATATNVLYILIPDGV